MTKTREEHLQALSDALKSDHPKSSRYFNTKPAVETYIADENDPDSLGKVLGHVLDKAIKRSPSETLSLINEMYGQESSDDKINAKKDELITSRLFSLLPKLPPSTLNRSGWISDLTDCFDSLNRKMVQKAAQQQTSLQEFVKKEWPALIEPLPPETQASLSSLIQSSLRTHQPFPLNKFATDCILAAAPKMTDPKAQLTFMGHHVLYRAADPAQQEIARKFLLSKIEEAANPNDVAVLVEASSNNTRNGRYVDETVDSAGAKRWTKLVSGLDIAKQWEAATRITDERNLSKTLASGETLTAARALTLTLAKQFIDAGTPEKAAPVLENMATTVFSPSLKAEELLKTISPAPPV